MLYTSHLALPLHFHQREEGKLFDSEQPVSVGMSVLRILSIVNLQQRTQKNQVREISHSNEFWLRFLIVF